MKTKYFFFFTIFAASLFAQNPDGKNVSLHLTPIWHWGSSQYSTTTLVYYPEQMQLPSQVVSSYNKGILENPFAFGMYAQIKIPAFSFLTVSVAYSYDQKFEQYSKYSLQSEYFSHFYKINGAIHTISATLSIYNLFSIYQE